MAWTRTDLARSYPCNASFLKQCRVRRNWTQKELADRAGYTERLIRKAESGRNISVGTIDDIASALSSVSAKIYPEDMITCYVTLARLFTNAWYCKQENMGKAIENIVHPKAVFRIYGGPGSVPFAGDFQGLAEFTRAVKQFFSMMTVPLDHDHKPHYRYFARGTDVAVWGESWIHPLGSPLIRPVPVTQRFHFERGKLVSFEDFCSQQRTVLSLFSARTIPAPSNLLETSNSEPESLPSVNTQDTTV